MKCEISPDGECGRKEGKEHQCGGCSQFLLLAIGAVDGGMFHTASVGCNKAVLMDRHANVVMQINKGVFKKNYIK